MDYYFYYKSWDFITVSQNVNLTDECSQDILKLITLQEKIFLIFCDLLIKKPSKKYK